MQCIHGCCVSSTHCLLVHLAASDRYKSLWTLDIHTLDALFPFNWRSLPHMEPLWNGMRLLLPLICNSLFISLGLNCSGDLAFWSIRCVSTHIMIVPGEKCNNIGHSFAVYNRDMKRHKGISEDSPRWLRSPTPCSPLLHTWHGLSSQYHHLGDPIRITRFYYSHKRRD